jgi:hypothetical protein
MLISDPRVGSWLSCICSAVHKVKQGQNLLGVAVDRQLRVVRCEVATRPLSSRRLVPGSSVSAKLTTLEALPSVAGMLGVEEFVVPG